jgi:peptide/nickel transport system substrate-binding protein
LKRRSNLLLEGLDLLIQPKGELPVGTGPFLVRAMGDRIEMLANETYHEGPPAISQIVFTPYSSVRSAWADMLRGRIDMLYDVGVDALDSLEPSKNAKVFTFQRPYAYLVTFNMRRPVFRSQAVRQALNAAINRNELVSTAFHGHGTPADGPVWPQHWAYQASFPTFKYDPRPIAANGAPLSFTCLYFDPTHERLGLVVQRQLQEVGVSMKLEYVKYENVFARLEAGDFDAFLTDVGIAPTMLRPFLFLYSRSPLNWGRFASASVDNALDGIRHAVDDARYQSGVAAFQHAVIDDPPAIFLAWSERARAVSTRFIVPAEPGRDILSTLRLWRPSTDNQGATRN